MNLHTAKRSASLLRLADSLPRSASGYRWAPALGLGEYGQHEARASTYALERLDDQALARVLADARLLVSETYADRALAMSMQLEGRGTVAHTVKARAKYRAARIAERHVAAVVEARLSEASETVRILRAALRKGAVASRKRAA